MFQRTPWLLAGFVTIIALFAVGLASPVFAQSSTFAELLTATVTPELTKTRWSTRTVTKTATPSLTRTKTATPTATQDVWQLAMTLGSGDNDWFAAVRQSMDGGFILAGATASFGAGNADAWVVRLDKAGEIAWQETYGGKADDAATMVIETRDGGLALAGYTVSFGAGGTDVWVLRLNKDGTVRWQKAYGGGGNETAYGLLETQDGGLIFASQTNSFGAGGEDAWVVKLDQDGSVAWEKTFGGVKDDKAFAIDSTSDGGWVVAGSSASSGAGGNDAWVFKLDKNGKLLWQKAYGGSQEDWAYSVQTSRDGGFVIGGSTNSFGTGGYESWVLKLDKDGNPIWQKAYGGPGNDYADSVWQTQDGGYILLGETDSFGRGGVDVWLVKLAQDGNITWQKTFGENRSDSVDFIQQTQDGGYVLAGWTQSFKARGNDAWVMRLNSQGNNSSCNATIDSAGGSSNTTASGMDSKAETQSTKATITTTAAVLKKTSAQPGKVCAVIQAYTPTPTPKYSPTPTATTTPTLMRAEQWAVRFARIADVSSYDLAAILKTSDGKYVLVGDAETGVSQEVWIIKIDTNGNTLWQKIYTLDTKIEIGQDIIETSDGGLVVAGIANKNSVWLLKVDQSGKVIWQQAFDPYLTRKIIALTATSDGGFALATDGTAYTRDYALVYRFKANGSLAWQKMITTSDEHIKDWRALSIRALSKDELLLVGKPDTDLALVKLSSTGSLVWQKTYEIGGTYAENLAVQPLGNDAGFIVASDGTSSTGSWVSRFQNDGTVVWWKTFGDAFDYITSISETRDGFVLTGFSLEESTLLIAMDIDGKILWQKSFQTGASDDSFALSVQAEPQGIAFAGTVRGKKTYSGYDLFAVKLDENGNFNGCGLVRQTSYAHAEFPGYTLLQDTVLSVKPQEDTLQKLDIVIPRDVPAAFASICSLSKSR